MAVGFLLMLQAGWLVSYAVQLQAVLIKRKHASVWSALAFLFFWGGRVFANCCDLPLSRQHLDSTGAKHHHL